jgi:hypothetical protein
MIPERRPIRQDEVEVIGATLERASVRPVTTSAAAAIHSLTVVGRCECGCASVDFDALPTEERPTPVADGIGETPSGGRVGIIVWGGPDAITGIEVYDLGTGDGDLVLPTPKSIVPWDLAGAG